MKLNLAFSEACALSKVLTRVANGELVVDEYTEQMCMDVVARLNTVKLS